MVCLTPKRVAIRRMIPVTQARVRLTRITLTIAVGGDEPSFSSNHREDGRDVNFTRNITSDPGGGVPLRNKTPTI